MLKDKIRFLTWLYLLSKLLLGHRYRPLKTNIVILDVVYVTFFSLKTFKMINESNIAFLEFYRNQFMFSNLVLY